MSERIVDVNINDELKTSFLTYAKLTILDRSLPDITGCKPVHTRILWGMEKAGIKSSKPYKKAGLAVGEVIGKYHPHGDSSVYEAMVRLSRDFIMRYPLIDAHGNVGAIDGSEAAAMRYVEMKLTPYAELMLKGHEKNAVPMVPTYAEDGTLEPLVLPGLFPNILVNGNEGIAVSTSCDWVPHNLTEVSNGIIAYIENKDIDTKGLMEHIPGPDFPLGGTIVNQEDIYYAYENGVHNKTIKVQGDYEIKGRKILFTSIPYGTDTTKIKTQLARHVDEISEYIDDVNDETNFRNGVKLIFDVKAGADINEALAVLFKRTDLQVGVPIRMNMVLGQGFEENVPLKKVIQYYVNHQIEVIKSIAEHDLEKSESRKHILEGLEKALANIDDVIDIIKASEKTSHARESLMERYSLTETQARAVLDIKLGLLTSMEIEDVKAELNSIVKEVKDLTNLISNRSEQEKLLVEQVKEMRDKYGDPRRTKITNKSEVELPNKNKKSYEIPDTEVNIAYLPNNGNIKTIKNASQILGQKTLAGAQLIKTKLNSVIAVFATDGNVYKAKVVDVKDTMQNIKSIASVPPGVDVIAAYGIEGRGYFTFCTANGMIKKGKFSDFETQRTVYAMKFKGDDKLVSVDNTQSNFAFLKTNLGEITIRIDDVRVTGRTGIGVIGVNMADGEKVVSAEYINSYDGPSTRRRVTSK